MKRWVARILLVLTALGVVIAPSAGARAGGWALASFDPLPPLEAGEQVDVGFTILQHGVTPAEVDHLGTDVGVTIAGADGESSFFPASPSGATGHYVATVTVPPEGLASVNAEMGIFESAPPFTVDVTAPGDPGGWPAWLGLLLPAVGVACLALLAADLLAARRARTATRPVLAEANVAVDPEGR